MAAKKTTKSSPAVQTTVAHQSTLFHVELCKSIYKETKLGDADPVRSLDHTKEILLYMSIDHHGAASMGTPEPSSQETACRNAKQWADDNTTEMVKYEVLSVNSAHDENILSVSVHN